MLTLAPYEDHELTEKYGVLLGSCEELKGWFEACLAAREADVCHMITRLGTDVTYLG